MISEELKAKVDRLSPEERHELSTYLTKLELQADPSYWETIRKRVAASPDQWVEAKDL